MKNKNTHVLCAVLAMILIVAASNYLVQFPLNEWLTWGTVAYPVTFLITEVISRAHGPQIARRIVYAGFLMAVALSVWLATPRIACASGLAFLLSQLLDIAVFTHIRAKAWWFAPFCASFLASFVDTALFWSLAFWGEPLPWLTLAAGDFMLKVSIDIAMLLPFRLIIARIASQPLQATQ